MMLVHEKIEKQKNYDLFINFCFAYRKKFDKVMYKKSQFENVVDVVLADQKAVLIAGGLLGFFTPIGLITGVIAQAVGLFYAKKFFKNMNEQRKITDKIERQNEN